jgi:hypothetical protein
MQAFIAMPFGPELDDVEKAIREACKYAGFNPLRADDIFRPGVVIDQIFDQLLKSDCVVGVLTGKNPNVYYEIGIAHGMSKPAILLHSKGNFGSLPFDIKHNRVIPYEPGKAREVISLIQAQLEFIKSSLTGGITSEKFLHNIDFSKDDIDHIRERLMIEYHFDKLSLKGMELLEHGKGVLLKFESPFGEKVVVSIDSNRMITRSEKL